MRPLQTERLEMEIFSATLPLQIASLLKTPQESSLDLSPGREVLVFKENTQPYNWNVIF